MRERFAEKSLRYCVTALLRCCVAALLRCCVAALLHGTNSIVLEDEDRAECGGVSIPAPS